MDQKEWIRRFKEAPDTLDTVRLEITSNKVCSVFRRNIAIVAMEELAELQQAISKMQRVSDDLYSYEVDTDKQEKLRLNLIEEMGDVIFQISVIMKLFNISEEELFKSINLRVEHSDELCEKRKESYMKLFIGSERI